MPNAKRGEIWQIDFGLAAKVRPALVLGCDIAGEDRVLVAVVYHTTALRGSRYEAPMNIPGLEQGGFDAQSLYTVPAVKLIRRRAVLNVTQLKQVEEGEAVAWPELNGIGFRFNCGIVKSEVEVGFNRYSTGGRSTVEHPMSSAGAFPPPRYQASNGRAVLEY